VGAKDEPYKYVPATRAQLVAYAKSLQRSRRGLSWAEAWKQAQDHEKERAINYTKVDDRLKQIKKERDER